MASKTRSGNLRLFNLTPKWLTAIVSLILVVAVIAASFSPAIYWLFHTTYVLGPMNVPEFASMAEVEAAWQSLTSSTTVFASTDGETRRERFVRDGYTLDIEWTSTPNSCKGDIFTFFKYTDESGVPTHELLGSSFEHQDGPCGGKDFAHAILEIIRQAEQIYNRLVEAGTNPVWIEYWLPFSRALFALANYVLRNL